MKYALITTSVIIFGLVTFIFVNQRMHYRETLSLEKEKLQLKSQIDSLRLMITQQQGGTKKEKDSEIPNEEDEIQKFKEFLKTYWGSDYSEDDEFYKLENTFVAEDDFRIYKFKKEGNSFTQIN